MIGEGQRAITSCSIMINVIPDCLNREPISARPPVVGQFDCGRVLGWKTDGHGRILRLMDDPAIKLYPDKNSGAWNWELLLRGKRIAYGESSDTQEAAYTAARQTLAEER